MKNENLTFPINSERFIEYQEAGTGRTLDNFEQGLFTPWVPVLNDAYRDGWDGESIEAMLDRIDQAIKREENPIVVRFEKSFRWWVCYAWNQGRQDAGKAVEV